MDAAHFLFIIKQTRKVRKVRLCLHLADGNRKSERGGSPQYTVSESVGKRGLDPAPSHHAVIPTYHSDLGWTLASAVSQAGWLLCYDLSCTGDGGGATKPTRISVAELSLLVVESVHLAEKQGSNRKMRQARRGSLCHTEACPSENQFPVLVKLGCDLFLQRSAGLVKAVFWLRLGLGSI